MSHTQKQGCIAKVTYSPKSCNESYHLPTLYISGLHFSQQISDLYLPDIFLL
jgi:hypothetical protein